MRRSHVSQHCNDYRYRLACSESAVKAPVKQLSGQLVNVTNNLSTWPSNFKVQSCQAVTFKSVQCHPRLTYIFNFWHLGTLALSPERQSARMSEIKNVCYTWVARCNQLTSLPFKGLTYDSDWDFSSTSIENMTKGNDTIKTTMLKIFTVTSSDVGSAIFCSYSVLTLSPPIPLRLYTLPYWSNPAFLISDIRALWRSVLSARAPECQKLKMLG